MDLRKRTPVDYIKLHSKGLEQEIIVNMGEKADTETQSENSEFNVGKSSSSAQEFAEYEEELINVENELKKMEILERLEKMKAQVREKKQMIEKYKSDNTSTVPDTVPNVQPTHMAAPQSPIQKTAQQFPTQQMGFGASQSVPYVNAATSYTSTPLLRMDLNPQSYLYSPDMEGHGKHRSIIDYIPRGARNSSESQESCEMIPGLTITAGTKMKLEDITPAQWVAANSNILADIIRKSPRSVQADTILDYLSYTAKIGEFATKFTWKSVILYDDDYRAKQHQFQFRWGSDSPHLSLVKLIARDQPKEDKHKKFKDTRKDSAHEHPANMPICRCYNEEQTCKIQPCRFQHVCEWCKGSHPRVKHDQSVKSA